MKKVVIVIALLVLLVACGSQTTGRRVSSQTTGAVIALPEENVRVDSAPKDSTTAADALKDLKSTTAPVIQSTGAKSGTFYPPVKVTGTGKDALKEKTRALMSSSAAVPGNVDADKDFGPKYFSSDGDTKNLPGDYGKSEAVE